ncbi:MAG: hypothetical protein WCP19_11345 [Chloroflexota bacterium]
MPLKVPVDWLLEGEPYIEYRTRQDLLGQPESAAEVAAARQSMLQSLPVQKVVSDLQDWPGKVIASHKSASQPFHKLTFLADLGLRQPDPGMGHIIEQIIAHQEPGGPFQLPMLINETNGGAAREQWAWALCDAPLILYVLAKFGLQEHPSVLTAVRHLENLVRENGWPCAVSKELGRYRGPGRKDYPCPFANLAMLKALSEFDGFKHSPACRTGAETLLSLWENSRSQHPYMFFMGDDFRKLKVPLIWYDLLNVLDVLSRFSWLKGDDRLQDMLEVLIQKMDGDGRFTIESAWTYWKDWEFGQKTTPSRWLTFTAWHIIQRF